MTISEIKVIESGDYNFWIEFDFEGHTLKTKELERTCSLVDVKDAAKQAILTYQSKTADTNFNLLKKALEGKTIEV